MRFARTTDENAGFAEKVQTDRQAFLLGEARFFPNPTLRFAGVDGLPDDTPKSAAAPVPLSAVLGGVIRDTLTVQAALISPLLSKAKRSRPGDCTTNPLMF